MFKAAMASAFDLMSKLKRGSRDSKESFDSVPSGEGAVVPRRRFKQKLKHGWSRFARFAFRLKVNYLQGKLPAGATWRRLVL